MINLTSPSQILLQDQSRASYSPHPTHLVLDRFIRGYVPFARRDTKEQSGGIDPLLTIFSYEIGDSLHDPHLPPSPPIPETTSALEQNKPSLKRARPSPPPPHPETDSALEQNKPAQKRARLVPPPLPEITSALEQNKPAPNRTGLAPSPLPETASALEQNRPAQKRARPSPSPPLPETALVLEQTEPSRKRAKIARQPKPRMGTYNNVTTVTHKPKGKSRRTRIDGPRLSMSPESEDGSEYEDNSTTVRVDHSKSPSTPTIPVSSSNAGSGSSSTTAIVEVGRKREKVSIRLGKDGWICPRDKCSHTTNTPHDMARHLQTLAHKKPEYVCKWCGRALTRSDALKRHMADRCKKV